MKRAKISSSMFGAKPHATVAIKQMTAPISSGLRRPVLSERGPTTSWPSAIPTMNALNVSDAFVLVVFRSSATAGSAARYMSVASGAIAVSSARTTIKMGDSPNEVLVDFEDISLSFFFLCDARATAPVALQDVDAAVPDPGMSLRRLEAQLVHPSRIGCGFVS